MPGKDRGQQWVRVDALEQRVQRRPFALQVRTGAGPARDDRGVDVERTRQRLRELRIAFDELPVPGYPLYQIFFKDPQGLKIELTFRTEEST